MRLLVSYSAAPHDPRTNPHSGTTDNRSQSTRRQSRSPRDCYRECLTTPAPTATPLVQLGHVPLRRRQEPVQARLVRHLGEFTIDSRHALPLRDHQPREVLTEVPPLFLAPQSTFAPDSSTPAPSCPSLASLPSEISHTTIPPHTGTDLLPIINPSFHTFAQAYPTLH